MAHGNGQRIIAVGLNLIAIGLLGLHLYVRWLPPTPTPIPEAGDAEAAWWGLWPATYPPGWLVFGASLLVIAMIGLLWLRAKPHSVAQSAAHAAAHTGAPFQPRRPSTAQMALLLSFALVLVGSFYAFPIVHTRWGDAYLISRSIAWPDPALRLTHSWQAPLDLFLHSQSWLFLHERFGWEDATPVYRLLSPVAGAIYLAVALVLSRQAWLAPGWLTFGSLATLGLMQLFFGYVENYSFAAAAILLYLWLGLAALRGSVPLWLTALALAVTNATHPSTVVLAPSLLYIGWQLYRDRELGVTRAFHKRRYSLNAVAWQIGLPVVAVALATLLMMEVGGHGIEALLTSDRPGGGDARWLVPLFETSTRWEYYTMFSWPHLRDFLNEQMLVAPVVLPTLVWLALCALRRRRRARPAPEESANARQARQQRSAFPFLLMAALCYMGFTWLWNPDYGGQRDWDLFSLAAIPAALLFSERLQAALPDRRLLRIGATPLLVVQALHSAAWVYQNTLPWSWP